MKASEILSESNLFELFNASAEVKILRDTKDYYHAVFVVGDTKYSLYMRVLSEAQNYWELLYGDEISPEHYTNTDPTGNQKEATMVLSTVVKVTERFILERKPNMITFTGDRGNGLAKLYRKMIKFLEPRLKQLHYSIRLASDAGLDVPGDDDYIITNDKYDFKTGQLIETLSEHASGGGTGAGSIATAVGGLGAGFDPNGDFGIYSKPKKKKSKNGTVLRR